MKFGSSAVDIRKGMALPQVQDHVGWAQIERYERTIALLKQALAASLPLLEGDWADHRAQEMLAARQKALCMLRDADQVLGRVSGRP